MLRLLKRLTDGRYYYPAALLLVILFTGMRLAHINADAPQDLSISAAAYTDEGFKTYDARNRVLFGDWKWTPEDQYGGWLSTSPLTVLPYTWIFSRFGVSYASIRVLSVAYAAVTMILLFLFLARTYDRLTALIGLVLFGSNYFTAMYNRLGLYEGHLICFVMIALFGFAEALRPRREARGAARAAARVLFLAVGIFGLAGGFFIKRNLLVIFPAVTPALVLYFFARRGWSERSLNRILVALIAAFALFYGIFAHFWFLRNALAFSLLSHRIFGQPIIAFLPFTAFDPIHMVGAKSMYMEFVFLHPFTFFAGMALALCTLHRFIFGERRNAADLVLSSWLVFGTVLLTLLYYNPSRYYLLFIIPLIALAARFIAGFAEYRPSSYITEKKGFPHNAMFWGFIAFMLLYTGIVFLVQTVPASARNALVDRLYPAYLKGDFSGAAVIIGIALALWLCCIAAAVLNRKRLLALAQGPKFPALLLSLILALQLFQYGKWFLFHEHNLQRTSVELGRELPPDAILAGSWSAGLVVENRLKCLILQSLIPYNHNLLKKLLYNIEIPVRKIADGKTATEYRGGMPVYLAVCRNVIFEKAIADMYREHFVPENLVKTVRFGYFRIEIYRLKKSRLEPKDEVKSLFNRFL
ncbi:MAG: hypothetical protein JW807_13590 [Spirochaetes bacterium]|nr:hypothetical protein [Spirochaetota bacterium]